MGTPISKPMDKKTQGTGEEGGRGGRGRGRRQRRREGGRRKRREREEKGMGWERGGEEYGMEKYRAQ